nr:hypothetical protein [Tanacetum cinerariifolium]
MDAIQADCDVKETNIILYGLPPEERECKLYDEFDKFAYKNKETLRDFYLIFSLLLNDKNIYKVKLEQFQVNTKSSNTLPPEWSKFITNSQQYSTNQSSTPFSITYPSNDYQSSVRHNVYIPQPSIPQLEYAPTVNQQSQQPEFPQLDSGQNVLVFKQGDDPIDTINHMMSILSVVVTSRYPTTNNQLMNSLNHRQQATINDGEKQKTVICYNYKGEGHMSKYFTKPKGKRDDAWFKDKVLMVQAQANGQILHEEELSFLADPGIADGQATQTDKVLMVQAQANGQILHEEELSFLADPGIADGQATQTVITHNASYQADDLDEYDSNCDEPNTAKVDLMANLSYFGSNVLTKLEPKLYDGNVIKNTFAITILDYEETLMLAEENFEKRFVPQTELYAEEAFWSHKLMHSLDPSPSCKPTRVGVPKELPKEKGLIIAALKDELRKLKGKALVDNVVTTHTIAPEMLKIDVEPIAPRLVKPSTSASGSHRSGNTKKDKIQRPPSSTQKNKVEDDPSTINSSLKNKNCAVEPKGTAIVQHSKLNANSKLICVKCNGCMLSDNNYLCVLNVINDVNALPKSKSVKKTSKINIWKPTCKEFTKTGYTWRHIGWTFTIVGNTCPLTRITTTTEVPPRKPTVLETDTPKPAVTLV